MTKQFKQAIDEHNAYAEAQFIKAKEEAVRTKRSIDPYFASIYLAVAKKQKSPENFILWKKGILKLKKISE